MSKNIYLWILRLGVYSLFFTFFFVFGGFLYPFITSKQIWFNIIIEILAVFWLAFIFKYPEYSPFDFSREKKRKLSLVTIGLFVYFIAITVTCFTGIDFNLSFWGDVERMLGVFHITHFLVYYLILITVMRNWKDWKLLLIGSITVAVFVSLWGLAKDPASRIGNAAYVGGYLIFNIYFTILLFFKEKDKVLRWIYLAPLVVFIPEFVNIDISGAYVGLGASMMMMFLMYAFLSKNKIVKIINITILAVTVAFVGLIYINKDKEFVTSNKYLRGIVEISLTKNTFQTRVLSWKAAWQEFGEHPILGTGFGNYAITFDRYFDPTFYNHTRSETYFDRAHNNLVDIVSTTGLLGLVSYLLIFIAALYYLIRQFRKKLISHHDFIVIFCLMAAYFIQNLVVFDSLVTYVSLMIMLGYINWISSFKEESNNVFIASEPDKPFVNKELAVLIIAGIISVLFVYEYNVKPMYMLKYTIEGEKSFTNRDIEAAYNNYKKALGYGTVLDRDSRTTMVRSLFSNGQLLTSVPKEKATEILLFAIDEMNKNIAYNPGDSMALLHQAMLYNVAARYYSDEPDRKQFYSDLALETIDKSINASQGRITNYFSKAQIQLTRGEQDKAIETMNYAISLNEDYYESTCELARLYFNLKEEEKGFEKMDACIDRGGAKVIKPASYVRSLINHYLGTEDYNKVAKLYGQLTRLEPKNTQYWILAARHYNEVGKYKQAIKAAKEAGDLDPDLSESVEAFISEVKSKMGQ